MISLICSFIHGITVLRNFLHMHGGRCSIPWTLSAFSFDFLASILKHCWFLNKTTCIRLIMKPNENSIILVLYEIYRLFLLSKVINLCTFFCFILWMWLFCLFLSPSPSPSLPCVFLIIFLLLGRVGEGIGKFSWEFYAWTLCWGMYWV